MLPKIKFKYSWVYDEMWKEAYGIKAEPEEYPDCKRLERYTGSVEKVWRKIEKNVLREMQRLSGLKWNGGEIICYAVTKVRPFSVPLTVPVYKDKTQFIDILVHELIHNLFGQNKGRLLKDSKFYKKYRKYNLKTRIHILLLAIHKALYLKFFSKKRIKRDIDRAEKYSKKYPQYKRAWEIVEKEGYENIIKEFRKRLD